MATRAMIFYKEADSVRMAYNHYDGYIEWLGQILYKHYNSKETACELTRKDISGLERTGEINAFKSETDNNYIKVGCLDTEQIYQFMEDNARYNGCEFVYFWDGEDWIVKELGKSKWQWLENELVRKGITEAE